MPFYSNGDDVPGGAPDKMEPSSNRYRDVHAEVQRIEARIRARSLLGVVITAADDQWLRDIGIEWGD